MVRQERHYLGAEIQVEQYDYQFFMVQITVPGTVYFRGVLKMTDSEEAFSAAEDIIDILIRRQL